MATLAMKRFPTATLLWSRARIATHALSSLRRIHSLTVDPEVPQNKVTNQSPFLEDYNCYTSDVVLKNQVEHWGADWADEELSFLGQLAGGRYGMELATDANNNVPVFESHDRQGRRQDLVRYHPAYHELMRLGIENEVPSFSWRHLKRGGSAVARSALSFLAYQLEQGTQCPQTMTFAAVPALQFMTQAQRDTCDYLKKSMTPVYDPRNVCATEKQGITCGMSMTEKQGGSDVRANVTIATPLNAGDDTAYLINGHKWFTSAPMCDVFLVLAQTENGLSCFMVPRWIPGESQRNEGLRFQRLKSKVGDRSNASSEVEYHNAYGQLLGEEGRGIRTILQMVQHTRLDCLVGSAGLMRRALAEALHHVSYRRAFGMTLIDAPIMRNLMADLALESEAATCLAMKIASTFDSQADPHSQALGRVATAVAKYHICKRAPQFVYECMEALGGNGYVDDGVMGRLFRQSPLNAIWEGSGNVICLDFLRCLAREPQALEALQIELSNGPVHNTHYAARLKDLQSQLKSISSGGDISGSRLIVGLTALLLQAKALADVSPEPIVEAFINSRLSPSCRAEYGTLNPNENLSAILERSALVGHV
eukprot:m.32009 g.32009  ORF g.32009 m.32009 type:complete len:595 (+) comp9483_c0_seq2:203-1987(+)